MPYKDPEAEREYRRLAAQRRRKADPERARQIQKRFRDKHRDRLRAEYDPTYNRNWWLKSNYGVTTDEWNAILASQGGVCALCGCSDPGTTKGWHTDHDHATGRVRGILCKGCNTALGLLGDSSGQLLERLARILEYVR